MQLTTCFAPRWRQEDSSGLRNTNRLIPVVLAAGMLLGMAMSVPAEPITPVAAKYSNAYSEDRVPTNLFNAAGMDANATYLYNLDGSPGGEPTSANGVSWVTTSWFNVATAAAAGRIWIVIDLGASYALGNLDIWNFQWETTADLSDRGISQFDVFVRNTEADTDDGTAGGNPINVSGAGYNNSVDDDAIFNLGTSSQWQLALSDQALAQAPNNDTYTATSFDLSGNTARFIAIRADSYYGGDGAGLGKVRVHVVPPPAQGTVVSIR
jgi:hypothetical protein